MLDLILLAVSMLLVPILGTLPLLFQSNFADDREHLEVVAGFFVAL